MFAYDNTSIENFEGQFIDIREFFHEQGFDEGGNWEYDHGYFDKKLADNPGYLFIRVPVFAQIGEFGDDETVVRLGRPFLLRHKFQVGNDDDVDITVVNATVNQFTEPQDADASLAKEEIEQAKQIIDRLDQSFRQKFIAEG